MTSDEFAKLRQKAEEETDSEAEKDGKVMLDLALAYSDGDGIEPNKDAFFVWVNRAAEAEEPEAAYELAYAHKNGIGTKPDHDLFIKCLQKAAKLKFSRAFYDLAILYKEGEVFETNEERFLETMTKAADKEKTAYKKYDAYKEDTANAMLELAFAFRDGIGAERNLDSYSYWLKEAAQQGNSEAMYHLAFEYYHPDNSKDMEEFIRWLKRAARKGQPDALYHLAIAYLKDEVPNASRTSYFRKMKEAAEAEVPEAMYHLAMYYLDAKRPDYKKFSLWIKRALEVGQPGAFIASGLDDLRKGSDISHQILLKLKNDLNELYKTVLEIKRDHIVEKDIAKGGVAHFTRFETLESMLPNKPLSGRTTNHLRLYNYAYMNDPNEGKSLLDEKFREESSLRKFFSGEDNPDNPLSWEEHESSVYIGSFTLIRDELKMWRTPYGNNGQGYCIITPWDAFDQGSSDEPVIRHDGEVVNVSDGALEATAYLRLTLYEVRYEDDAVKKTLNILESKLKDILTARDEILKTIEHSENTAKVLDRIVRQIVSHILYLYKSKHYQDEQEARLIADYDISFQGIKFDLREKPSRLYVETMGFLFPKGSSIIIGPRVEHHTVAELDIKRRLACHKLHRRTKVLGSKLRGIYR